MLNTYNQTWVKTINMDRFAKQSIVFDNHWLGSAPCMPARRDIFTGRLNFLERNWGPIEPFDLTLQEKLRQNGIFTHITTDHLHYFEIGGENYCQLFDTWDFHRGQEYDPWISKVKHPEITGNYYGKVYTQYELNRSKIKHEADFSTAKTFASACEWLRENKDSDDFFLMVESFDPHEPFDCEKEYLETYNDDYKGPKYNWSDDAPVKEPKEAIEHLKKRYAGTLTMADKWFGKFLDVIDEYNMWEDTLIIFTTDHGHLLGEHGFTGKNVMHAYNELAHIPLIVHLPGSKRAGERINALTQNIDLMPTILDYYYIGIPECVRGHSLRGILEDREQKVRDTALYGWHGKAVNITDGKYTYFRAPTNEDNYPCYVYCAMPSTIWRYMGKNCLDKIETGRFLRHTDYPVFKIPVGGEDLKFVKESLLFDIENDYQQEHPIKDIKIEKILIKKLKNALTEADSPSEQLIRLGIN